LINDQEIIVGTGCFSAARRIFDVIVANENLALKID
jgi:hypothetical protein